MRLIFTSIFMLTSRDYYYKHLLTKIKLAKYSLAVNENFARHAFSRFTLDFDVFLEAFGELEVQ